MARRQKQSAVGGVVLILLIVALIVIGIYIVSQRQGGNGSGATTMEAGTQAAGAEDLVSDNRTVFGGEPRAKAGAISITVLHNIAYTVGYSEERRDPLWSAYRVMRVEKPFVLKRPTGEFLTDNRTMAKVAHHDFTGSGYDRGHMTPNSAIARCFGVEAQKETFLLSNICPQSPALNEKVWEKLERKELDYADKFGEVWMVDGPVFGGEEKKLRSGISVPVSFYKILIEEEGGVARVFAVEMPQGVRGTELPQEYVTSVSKIEEETGLEFLWKLPVQQQQELKSSVRPMW